MCASSTTLSLLLVFISLSMKMVSEGLPVATRWERGNHRNQDIIAGADFLSILMDSPAERQAYKELTSSSTTSSPNGGRYARRSSTLTILQPPEDHTPEISSLATEDLDSLASQTQVDEERLLPLASQEIRNANGSTLVVSVRVSSSEGDVYVNKISNNKDRSDFGLNVSSDQIAIPSEDHPSAVIAQVGKHDLMVDEKEPILDNFSHRSVVYHDDAGEENETIKGRSVSYSTVIQALPNRDQFESEIHRHETPRQERHYQRDKNAPKQNHFEYFHQDSHERRPFDAENSTSTENDYNVSASSEDSVSSSTASVSSEPEKNWETSEKVYGHPESTYYPPVVDSRSKEHYVPVVYERAEQNYEVDESVSVMSNGRAHGIQQVVASTVPLQASSTPPVNSVTVTEINSNSKPTNDSQKVGYVVEGRNYRKYRVEERTSDGFIVGEYGVVSHDDGSLRGVRYTADGTINPRVIYEALMKFLAL